LIFLLQRMPVFIKPVDFGPQLITF
jgi:hypothetical protein